MVTIRTFMVFSNAWQQDPSLCWNEKEFINEPRFEDNYWHWHRLSSYRKIKLQTVIDNYITLLIQPQTVANGNDFRLYRLRFWLCRSEIIHTTEMYFNTSNGILGIQCCHFIPNKVGVAQFSHKMAKRIKWKHSKQPVIKFQAKRKINSREGNTKENVRAQRV